MINITNHDVTAGKYLEGCPLCKSKELSIFTTTLDFTCRGCGESVNTIEVSKDILSKKTSTF